MRSELSESRGSNGKDHKSDHVQSTSFTSSTKKDSGRSSRSGKRGANGGTKIECSVCGMKTLEEQLRSKRHIETKIHLACQLWGDGVLAMFQNPKEAFSLFHEAQKALKKSHVKWRKGIMDAILLAKELTIVCERQINASGMKFREPSMCAIPDMEGWLVHLSSCGNKPARLCINMWDHVKKFRITDTTVQNWKTRAKNLSGADSGNETRVENGRNGKRISSNGIPNASARKRSNRADHHNGIGESANSSRSMDAKDHLSNSNSDPNGKGQGDYPPICHKNGREPGNIHRSAPTAHFERMRGGGAGGVPPSPDSENVDNNSNAKANEGHKNNGTKSANDTGIKGMKQNSANLNQNDKATGTTPVNGAGTNNTGTPGPPPPAPQKTGERASSNNSSKTWPGPVPSLPPMPSVQSAIVRSNSHDAYKDNNDHIGAPTTEVNPSNGARGENAYANSSRPFQQKGLAIQGGAQPVPVAGTHQLPSQGMTFGDQKDQKGLSAGGLDMSDPPLIPKVRQNQDIGNQPIPPPLLVAASEGNQNKIACPRCGTRVRFLRYNNGKQCIDKASLVKHLLNSCARMENSRNLGRIIHVLKAAKRLRKAGKGKDVTKSESNDNSRMDRVMSLSMRDVQNADVARLRQTSEWYEGAEQDLILLRREVDNVAAIIQNSHYYLKQKGLLQSQQPHKSQSLENSEMQQSSKPTSLKNPPTHQFRNIAPYSVNVNASQGNGVRGVDGVRGIGSMVMAPQAMPGMLGQGQGRNQYGEWDPHSSSRRQSQGAPHPYVTGGIIHRSHVGERGAGSSAAVAMPGSANARQASPADSNARNGKNEKFHRNNGVAGGGGGGGIGGFPEHFQTQSSNTQARGAGPRDQGTHARGDWYVGEGGGIHDRAPVSNGSWGRWRPYQDYGPGFHGKPVSGQGLTAPPDAISRELSIRRDTPYFGAPSGRIRPGGGFAMGKAQRGGGMEGLGALVHVALDRGQARAMEEDDDSQTEREDASGTSGRRDHSRSKISFRKHPAAGNPNAYGQIGRGPCVRTYAKVVLQASLTPLPFIKICDRILMTCKGAINAISVDLHSLRQVQISAPFVTKTTQLPSPSKEPGMTMSQSARDIIKDPNGNPTDVEMAREGGEGTQPKKRPHDQISGEAKDSNTAPEDMNKRLKPQQQKDPKIKASAGPQVSTPDNAGPNGEEANSKNFPAKASPSASVSNEPKAKLVDFVPPKQGMDRIVPPELHAIVHQQTMGTEVEMIFLLPDFSEIFYANGDSKAKVTSKSEGVSSMAESIEDNSKGNENTGEAIGEEPATKEHKAPTSSNEKTSATIETSKKTPSSSQEVDQRERKQGQYDDQTGERKEDQMQIQDTTKARGNSSVPTPPPHPPPRQHVSLPEVIVRLRHALAETLQAFEASLGGDFMLRLIQFEISFG